MTHKTIGYFRFIIFIASLNYFGHDYSVDISFPHQICTNFKGIDSSLLALLLVQIVEHKLKILARWSKHNLVFPAIEFIVKNLYQVVVDKDVAIDDIEHASDFHILVLWMD